MPPPLVSAIVLCYNQASFVVECLEAVKLQNFQNLELIVHDDASRDDSADVIQLWLENSGLTYRFFKQTTNQGLCRSINFVLSHASGKYVSAVAADDVWLPDKLLTQVEIMEHLPDKVGVLYSDAFQIDERGSLLPKRFIEAHRHFTTMPEGDIHKIMWEGNFIPAMTTLVRRECYQQVGPFDETLFYEDWDMWLRISRKFDFVYSPEVSAKYRIVSTSMIRSQRSRMLDSTCRMCFKHLAQSSLTPEAKRLVLTRVYNDMIEAMRGKTPEYKRHLVQGFGLAMTDTTALASMARVVGRKIQNKMKLLIQRNAKPRN
jgi:glycosyltransferase involved in cell wall biosynthesis